MVEKLIAIIFFLISINVNSTLSSFISINFYQLNCEMLLSMSTTIVQILAYQLSLINELNISAAHTGCIFDVAVQLRTEEAAGKICG